MTASKGPGRGAPAAGADLDEVRAGLLGLQRLLASRRVHQRWADAAGAQALSQQAIGVLRAAAGATSARPVAEVARAARMDIGAVSRQLRVLEAAELVTRRSDEDNGSVVLVAATSAGRDLASRVEAVQRVHLESALSTWDSEEVRLLGRLLVRLVDDLQRTPYRPR